MYTNGNHEYNLSIIKTKIQNHKYFKIQFKIKFSFNNYNEQYFNFK